MLFAIALTVDKQGKVIEGLVPNYEDYAVQQLFSTAFILETTW